MPALDGLRGLAILLVLAHDYNLLEDAESTAGRLLGLALNSGWLGVQLFFVLSGYLITGILIDTKKADNYWAAFLGRRAVRIFPLYYAVLFAAFVVAPLVARAPAGSEHQIWFWTYLANWAEPFGRSVSIFPHFWSLSIEEQFYLFWPLVVRRLSPRGLAGVCFGLVILAVTSRILVRPTEIGTGAAYMFTVCRVDALALGAAGALAVRDERVRAGLLGRRTLLRIAAFALFASTFVVTRGAPRTGIWTQTFGYTVFAIVFAYAVVDAALGRDEERFVRVLSASPLGAVGRYSYGMYVFHTPLHLLVGLPAIASLSGIDAHGPHGIAFSLAYFLGATAVTFVLALASYHLLEKHFLALKARIAPRVHTR
ncbi:MAG TPA: acyltransferase [Labilithrix sp.]|nr:acyltransferase [Labilithrix sp.]